MRYQSYETREHATRTATVGRAARIARNEAQLRAEYAKYRRMGFDHDEARWKALQHHSMKL